MALRFPQGTWLGVPVQAVHMDEDLYNEPYEYNPFRFANMRLGNDKLAGEEKIDAIDISDTFLRWIYGRYAWSVLSSAELVQQRCRLPFITYSGKDTNRILLTDR